MTSVVVWKFRLFFGSGGTNVGMARGTKVLTAQMKNGEPFLWALVDPDAPTVARHFVIVGTGTPFNHPDYKEYVATFQDGPFVWHVFETDRAKTVIAVTREQAS